MKSFVMFFILILSLYGQQSQILPDGNVILDPIDQILWAIYGMSYYEGASYQMNGDSLDVMLKTHFPFEPDKKQPFITTVEREGAKDGWLYAKADTLRDINKLDKTVMFTTFLKFIGVMDE